MTADPALADYYAQRAAEYERIYLKPERQPELRQLKQLVRAAMAQRDVLEIACGTGYWTEAAAGSATSIAAFDINEAVLEIARSKPINPGKVTFAIGDAYQLPVAPSCFNAALSVFWWSHIPRKQLADFLTPLHRTLQPGATVVFIDNTHVPGESTPISRTDDAGNTYQLRRIDKGGTFEVLKNYPTEQELRDAVAGFAGNIEIKWLKYYWWFSYQIGDPSPVRHD